MRAFKIRYDEFTPNYPFGNTSPNQTTIVVAKDFQAAVALLKQRVDGGYGGQAHATVRSAEDLGSVSYIAAQS